MAGFLQASGRALVDEDGTAIRLRGVGIGNWLLPEGYMWHLPASADRPRRMEHLIESLVGQQRAREFWSGFRDSFIGEVDVAELAADGYNSIRLPLNARLILNDPIGSEDDSLLNEKEMARVDRLIDWCRNHGVYVVLDLHGAPGGQTGTNIDDSENDRPELFERREFADLTVRLWKALAARYADEWAVAGYDLLNEPLPDWFSMHNSKVLPLYRRITEAIREVDRRHTIILEGVHWATDWSIFTERVDDNLMLQFHKYWNSPDRESLAPYLALRESWNVPIYMGEGGENNTDWYTGAFGLYEDLNISWNFWTWKKMDTSNSPLSIRRPEGWSRVALAAEGRDEMTASEAQDILHSYLENVPSARCDRNPEVTRALFRRPPVRVPAVFYVNRPEGIGYFTPAPIRNGDASGLRATDRVPMAFVAREGMPHVTADTVSFRHMRGEAWADDEWIGVRLVPGSWLAYAIEVASDACLRVTVDYYAARSASIEISCGQRAAWLRLPGNGATQSRSAVVSLEPGLRRLKVGCREGEIHLVSITCAPECREV